MATIAYLRVSTDKQDISTQKVELLEFANREGLRIDEFIELEVSSRKSLDERGIEELLARLTRGDLLLVSELSRLGRSLQEIIRMVNQLVESGVKFIAIKNGIRIDGAQDMSSKIQVAMFGLFAELERDLVSQRTRMGMARARAQGKVVGRPRGSWGPSKLDGKEADIRRLLEAKVAVSAIARLLGVSRNTVLRFMERQGLQSVATP